MIKDRRAHLARLNRMIAMADIVKVSDEDVAWMTGKDDAKAAARKWLKLGAKIVRRHARRQGGGGLHRRLRAHAAPPPR